MKERESMIGTEATGSMKIANHYVIAVPLYKKIKELGMTVTGFHRHKNQVVFTYTTGKRHPFTYHELMQLQNIINPQEPKEYPIPWGYYGDYTLYIQIPNLAK